MKTSVKLIEELQSTVPKYYRQVSQKIPADISYEIRMRKLRGFSFDFEVMLSSNKPLQRPLCWSLEKKQNLILSMLKGNWIGIVLLVKSVQLDKSIVFKVIDGKQRLSTIISFLENEFPIVLENQEIWFKDCSEEFLQSLFVLCHWIYEYPDTRLSDKELIKLFKSVNWDGEPQMIEHINSLEQNYFL
jgi:hypothetical protein